MTEELQTLLHRALLNNSYDYSAMHSTLKSTWENSYSYLYTLQKAYIQYEELFYYSNDETARNSSKIGNMYLDKKLRACFDIDYDLVHVFNREEYRRSEYYGEEITYQTMVDNPSIFNKIPVIMIDDQAIFDYSIKISKNATSIILPFKRQYVIYNDRNTTNDEVVYVDHKIQVLVVDNVFYQRLKLNKTSIQYSRENKTLYVSKEYLTATNLPKTYGTMFLSLHFINDAGKGYELGTQIMDLVEDDNGYTCSISDELSTTLFTCMRDFYVSVFFISKLKLHTFYTGKTTTSSDGANANLMVLEKSEMTPYAMPIPIEDFMIFKRTSGGQNFYLQKNTDMLQMYYPNIYRLDDESMEYGDEYKVYYFYYEGDDGLTYTPIHDFYYRYLKNLTGLSIEEVIDRIFREDYIPSTFTETQVAEFRETFLYILNYEAYNHKYGEMDFLNRYSLLPGNEHKGPLEYQHDVMRAWEQIEPEMLRNYVNEQNKLNNSYHLFTNTIDLSGRLRTDTSNELDTTTTFDSPRYVFAFSNTKDLPTLLDCRIFVDGIFVSDLIHERKLFMDYFYIPQSMITTDSYIEVELFPSYSFEEKVTFATLDDSKEITITEPDDNIFPTIADIYYVDNSTSPSCRYNRTFFDITSHYDEADIEVVQTDDDHPVKFTRLNTFTIKPSSEEVLNKEMTLTISKVPNGIPVKITTDGYPYLQFVDTNFNFSINYLRIYKDGRLIPREKYTFFSSFSCPRLQILDWCTAGDVLYLDITPFRYTEIYYKEDITSDNGIIDLSGIINKPFDVNYYDIYINGRKLSLNNVISLDAWSITLVNLKSNYNLTIYERERDYEFFGLNYARSIYYFSLDDLFKKDYVTDEEKKKLIDSIIEQKKDHRLTINPNTNDEEKMDYTDLRKYAIVYIFYYDELLPKGYVNPDELQFNNELLSEDYYVINENYHITPADQSRHATEKKRRQNYPDVICLDPDIMLQGESVDDEQYVFPVGHLEEVEDSILTESIEIKNTYSIKK